MKKLKQQYSVLLFTTLLILSISVAFPQSGSSSQKPSSSGNIEYYYNDHSSNSSLSEASNRNYRRENREDFRGDDYRREKDSNRNYEKEDSYSYNKRNYNHRELNSENYFRIDKSGRTLWDGKHWNYSEYPLKVFVKESSSRLYKNVYKDYVKYAFNVWRKADDRITFKFVSNEKDADVSVLFIENLGKKYNENYLGLTEYDTRRNKEIEFSKVQISLIKFNDELVSAGEIKATIVHELGHVFGLGHSDNVNDIMYPYIDENHSAEMNYDELSIGDKLAVTDAVNLGYSENYVSR